MASGLTQHRLVNVSYKLFKLGLHIFDTYTFVNRFNICMAKNYAVQLVMVCEQTRLDSAALCSGLKHCDHIKTSKL